MLVLPVSLALAVAQHTGWPGSDPPRSSAFASSAVISTLVSQVVEVGSELHVPIHVGLSFSLQPLAAAVGFTDVWCSYTWQCFRPIFDLTCTPADVCVLVHVTSNVVNGGNAWYKHLWQAMH